MQNARMQNAETCEKSMSELKKLRLAGRTMYHLHGIHLKAFLFLVEEMRFRIISGQRGNSCPQPPSRK